MEKGLGVEMEVPTVSREGPPVQEQVSSEPHVACLCHGNAADVSYAISLLFLQTVFLPPLFNLFVLSLTHVNRYVMSIQCEPETNKHWGYTREPNRSPASHGMCTLSGQQQECMCACKIYKICKHPYCLQVSPIKYSCTSPCIYPWADIRHGGEIADVTARK